MPLRVFPPLNCVAARLTPSPVVIGQLLLLSSLCAGPAIADAQCSGTPTVTMTSTNSSAITLNDLADPNQGITLSTPETANSPNYPVSISVPTADAGTVTCIQVQLNNINAPAGNVTQALYYTEILLVSPTGQQMVLLGGPGLPSNSVSGLTFLIGDGYASMPTDAGTISFPGSPTTQQYKPTSNILVYGLGSTMPTIGSPGSNNIANASFPQTDASATMNTTHSGVNGVFSGVQSNGTWSLYVADLIGDPVTIQNWTLKLWVSQSQASTTTTISSSVNPTAPGNSVTYTATVTSSSGVNSGTVSFYANGSTSPLACTQGTAVAVNSSGQAQCTVTLSAGSTTQCTATSTTGAGTSVQSLPVFPTVCQGNQSIDAAYSGNSSFASSTSATLTQVVSGTQSHSGDQWCNTSPIVGPNDNTGIAYPSFVSISGYPAGSTVSTVSVNLNSVQGSTDINGEFLLVAPGSGGQNLDFWDDAFNATGTSGVNLTIEDGAGQLPAGLNPTSGTFEPYDGESASVNTSFPASVAAQTVSAIPAIPGTLKFPAPHGSASNTFASSFNSAPANGDWALYVTAANGAGNFIVNGGWCVNLTVNTGVASTTAVTSSKNPAQPGQSVTYTGTVTSGGSPVTSGGTVTFLDNNLTPGGTTSGNNVVNLSAAGTATFTSSSLYNQIDFGATPIDIYEGDHTITASYGGSLSDNPSTGTLIQRLDNPTVLTSTSGASYSACNSGPIYANQGHTGAFTPNPSVISAANIPGTVNTVSLTLNNFSTSNALIIPYVESLVEGPTGAALDFFSGAGSGTTNNQLASGAYTFSDSGLSAVPTGSFGPGTYLPTSYLSGDTYTSSISGFYNAPGSFSYSQPQGVSTFSSTFGNTNPNGSWKLFFNEKANQGSLGAANGWCLNFTENLPAITVDEGHSGSGTAGDFVQGQANAQITTTITNNGPGATGDPTGSNPLTLTDTLNSALTYAGFSGAGWSCSNSGQTVTCRNDSAVAQNSTYPALTLNVNVASFAPSSITNSISVSGAGTSGGSASDTINVDAAPALLLIKTHTGTFTLGSTAQWNLVVSNTAASGATSGVVTVIDALPSGYTLSSYISTGGLWSCSGSSVVTCTASPGISAGSSSMIVLTVNVPANSPTSVSNVASAYGGGDLVHTSAATAAFSNTDTATVALAQATTTLSLGANPATSAYGQQVVLTATLTPYTSQGFSSNGEFVTFYNGANSLGSGTLINGVATLNTSTLPVGTDSITAIYIGDSYLLPSTASALPVVITPANYVVTTATDDAGLASNCTPQSSTTTGTDASCSLRDALLAAAGSGGANITFSSTGFASAQTITLGSAGTLTIPSNTTITGATTGSGAALVNLVTVSGSGSSSNFSVFTVNSGVTGAVIRNLIIANGYVNTQGGGINSSGSLSVSGSTFANNYAAGYLGSGNGGGAIYVASGALAISDSTFSGNTSAPGGAIAVNSGTVIISQSTFSGNSAIDAKAGGAMFINGGTVTIAGSTFSGNSAAVGGAVYNNGTMTTTNTIMAGNTGGDCGAGGASSCPSNGAGGNVIGVSGIVLAPLANYGGPMQTMIPLPGSAAICAGLQADIASGVTTDQRGLPNTNTSYPGYSAGAPCVDAGAVQTNYALSFSTQPSAIAASEAMAPAPAVTLTESGTAAATSGVTIPLTLTGSGALTGGSASTNAGVATYNNLSVSTAGTGDTLTASLPMNPNLATPFSLTAISNPFSVTAGLKVVQQVSAAFLTENFTTSAFTPVTGSGGTGTLTYNISPALPAGLSFSTTTGAVSGDPTVTSPATTYTVTVTDQNGATASASFVLTVNGPLVATTAIASKSLTVNTASTPFTPVTGSGGTGTLSYSILPPLPAGLSFSTTTGAISGTPTLAVAATIYTVKVTDQNSATASTNFTLTVNNAVTAAQAIASRALTQNYAATAFTPVTGAGGTAPLVYSISPSLPAGLSFSTATGTISGTPTTAISATSYTVTVTDANSATATASFVLAVNAAVSATQAIASESLTYGTAASFTPVTGSGGTGTLTYSISPAMPTGLSFNASTGAITGTPSAAGAAASYTVTVTDVNGATAAAGFTLVVNKATATVTLSNLTQTYTGASLSATAVTSPVGLAVSFTYNGSATAPTAAGSYAVVGAINDPNYQGSASGTLTINKAGATVTLGNLGQTYTGSPLSVTAITSPTGLAISFTYNGSAAAPTAAGSYAVVGTINDPNYQGSGSGTLTIAQAAPSITWSAPAAIAYGTALSGTQLDASANVPGTFTYAPAAGTVLPIGSQTLSAAFTPADVTDYAKASKTVSIAINAATLAIKANNATRVYGAANPAFTGSVTGQQNGDTFIESFSTTATISSPVNAYPIAPSVTGADLVNYAQTITDGTLTITQAASTTALAVSSASITPGQSVTLTATVASTTTGTPTGTVNFYDNGALLNTTPAILSGGVAAYATASLAPGVSHVITATYSGDVNFTGSSSSSSGSTIGVALLDFTMTLIGPTNLTVVPGQSISYQVQVTPDYGNYAGAVSFAVSGLPSGATVTFSPSSIAASGGPQTITVTIQTVPATAMMHGEPPASPGSRKLKPFALACLLLIGARTLCKRGKMLRGLLCVLALAGAGLGASMLGGCGSSSGFFGQAPQNYSVTITATAANVQHSTTITLNVQ